jgi:hypothetical protein
VLPDLKRMSQDRKFGRKWMNFSKSCGKKINSRLKRKVRKDYQVKSWLTLKRK